MGNFNRDDNRSGGYRGGFSRGGDRGGFRGGRSDRPMFSTICSNCGKECQVPFRPTNGKPVYCSDCFEKMGNRSGDSRRFDDRAPRSPQAQGGPDLGAINAKLDKILAILAPTPIIKEEKTVKPEAVKKIAEVVDLPKIKKAVKKAVKKVASVKK